MNLGVVVLTVVVAGLLYIRLAPSDAARWHVLGNVPGDKDFAGGVMRLVAAGPDALETLDAFIKATDRTEVLAGSVEQGMITYVTRSKWIGFPDYTTLRQTDNGLAIYGRLRFGRSDLGVNRKRVENWLALGQF